MVFAYLQILINDLYKTTDITICSQSPTVMRYVKKDSSVEERILILKNMSENPNSKCMIVYNITKDFNGYKNELLNRAAVMAEQIWALQGELRETFPSALFVHCFAHKLIFLPSITSKSVKYLPLPQVAWYQ